MIIFGQRNAMSVSMIAKSVVCFELSKKVRERRGSNPQLPA